MVRDENVGQSLTMTIISVRFPGVVHAGFTFINTAVVVDAASSLAGVTVLIASVRFTSLVVSAFASD